MVITGAPVEHMDFGEVKYWRELERIMDWTKDNVRSTLFICWAAQAALNHYYGIDKQPLTEKMFGVFPHRVLDRNSPLMRDFEDSFPIPVSRHTAVDESAAYACNELHVIAASDESGIGLMVSRDSRFVFATGHSEYDADTLAGEYFRDRNKGLEIAVPKNYFPDNSPEKSPIAYWHTHTRRLFQNWINDYVCPKISRAVETH
jgi:homoserine O-succinyltransferase